MGGDSCAARLESSPALPMDLMTERGKRWNVSHRIEGTDQFNNIGFVDDCSLLAQSTGGMQALMDTVQEFEKWSGMKVNLKKTCLLIIDGNKERRKVSGRPREVRRGACESFRGERELQILGVLGNSEWGHERDETEGDGKNERSEGSDQTSPPRPQDGDGIVQEHRDRSL
jgi:hypothetical protein